jgi:hypothetical protein
MSFRVVHSAAPRMQLRMHQHTHQHAHGLAMRTRHPMRWRTHARVRIWRAAHTHRCAHARRETWRCVRHRCTRDDAHTHAPRGGARPRARRCTTSVVPRAGEAPGCAHRWGKIPIPPRGIAALVALFFLRAAFSHVIAYMILAFSGASHPNFQGIPLAGGFRGLRISRRSIFGQYRLGGHS